MYFWNKGILLNSFKDSPVLVEQDFPVSME